MDCTTAGWLWYCDPHDTHGNADFEEEARATADGHTRWWAAEHPDEEPCYIVVTAVEEQPLGELVQAAIAAPSDNRTIGGRVRDAEPWFTVWSQVAKEHEMTSAELAAAMGKEEGRVAALLKGEMEPSVFEAVAFAAATGTSSSLIWQVVVDYQLRVALETPPVEAAARSRLEEQR